MSAAAAVTPPGGRVVQGWWRELAPWQPQRLWFAHLLLSRVEALVEEVCLHPLDPFQQALLHALALPEPALELHLERPVLGGLLGELSARGLVRLPDPEGPPCPAELTDAGREALRAGGVTTRQRERRVFHFAELAAAPPQYLPLSRPAGTPLAPPNGWQFDLSLLDKSVRQTPDWKARQRFPSAAERVFPPPGEAPADWREVVLVRPEQLLLALIRVPPESGGPSLLGFAVQADGWVLQREAPVLEMAEPWPEALQELTAEPAPEAWRLAWQAWCQPRSIPPAEVAECRLEPADHRLLVRAPARLVERLRAARSDALKGEAWLLAGTGRGRAAALIELVETS
jgi:hypothetical protein